MLWVLFIAAILVAMVVARRGDWIVRPGHFAERHGLIIIIALGEVVVAIGISVVESFTESEGLSNPTLVGLTAAGVLAGLLWWSYFDRVLPALEHHSESLDGRPRAHFTADAYTGFHVFIVGGTIATAAAVEEVLLHPSDPVHTEFLVMMCAGFALYFGGIALAVYRAYGVVATERLTATAVSAALAYLGRSWDGVALLVVIDVVIFISLVAEHVRVEAPSRAAHTHTA